MSVRPLRAPPAECAAPRRHAREPERRAAAAQLDLRPRPLLGPVLEQLASRVGASEVLVVAMPLTEPVVLATHGLPFPDSTPSVAWLASHVVADAEAMASTDLRAPDGPPVRAPRGALALPLCTRDGLPVGALIVTAPAPWANVGDALPHAEGIARLLEAHLELQQREGFVQSNHVDVMARVDMLLTHQRELAERRTEVAFLVRELVHAQYFGADALGRARQGEHDALADLEAVHAGTFERAQRLLALLGDAAARRPSPHAPIGIPSLLRWVQQSMHDLHPGDQPVLVQARLSRSPNGDAALLHHALTLLCQAAARQAPSGAPVCLVARDIAHGWALEVTWPGAPADALPPAVRRVVDEIAEAHEGFFVHSPSDASPSYQLCLPYD